MKKIGRILLLLLLVVGFVLPLNMVDAETKIPASIQLGSVTSLPSYIGGTYFQTKTLKNGGYAYCTDLYKDTPINMTMYLVGEKDAGYAYILQNGYPNKSFTGNGNYDYYITQTAMWWYIDEVEGDNNLSDYFKTNADDPHNLRPHIKNLVNKALEARKAGYQKPTLSMSSKNSKLSLSENNKYYVSDTIKVTSTQVEQYKVVLDDVPKNTMIINTNGKEQTTFKANESFKIQVPVSSMKNTEETLKFHVEATATVSKAYLYEAKNDSIQDVLPAVLYPSTIDVSASMQLYISTSRVSIVKLDEKTNQPLAGATLRVEDEKGNVVDQWISTINPHVIRDLPNGTYFLREIEAPKGYHLLDEPVSFTISDQQRDIEVTMENVSKTSVVTILKIDKETGKPLAGATLVVKDSSGKEIYHFVTTEEAYVIEDLEDGIYTVEEIEAPDGYMMDDNVTTFEIDEDHLSHQIIIENYPEVEVPPTSHMASLWLSIIGGIGILSGIGYIYYHGKKQQQ